MLSCYLFAVLRLFCDWLRHLVNINQLEKVPSWLSPLSWFVVVRSNYCEGKKGCSCSHVKSSVPGQDGETPKSELAATLFEFPHEAQYLVKKPITGWSDDWEAVDLKSAEMEPFTIKV